MDMNFLFKLVKKIELLLVSIEKKTLVILFILMVLLAFFQVVLRQFFQAGILWGDIFLRHLVLWVGFLGAAIASYEKKHFTIDFLEKYLSEKARYWSQFIIQLFAVVILCFLTNASIKFLKDDISSRSILFSIGNYEIPTFWMNSIIPIGFILVLIHFSCALVGEIIRPFRTDNEVG